MGLFNKQEATIEKPATEVLKDNAVEGNDQEVLAAVDQQIAEKELSSTASVDSAGALKGVEFSYDRFDVADKERIIAAMDLAKEEENDSPEMKLAKQEIREGARKLRESWDSEIKKNIATKNLENLGAGIKFPEQQ